MSQKSNQVVFFGSGPVAAKSLQLLSEWCTIELVVTKTKPPHHKEPALVEEYAKNSKIKLCYADNKDQLDELINIIKPKSGLGIVIDYGVIIGASTIDYFKYGIINSHFSLLPQWRGADPITFALLSGQKETGVSLMLIDTGLDTGDIISESMVQISKNETNTTLTEKLIEVSNKQLEAMIPLYLSSNAIAIAQNQISRQVVTYSRKLVKNDGLLDVNKPVIVLEREIRAYNEWPKSRIEYKGTWLTITQAKATNQVIKPGLLIVKDGNLLLGCKNGSLHIIELQPAGKNKMSSAAFINGYSHLLN